MILSISVALTYLIAPKRPSFIPAPIIQGGKRREVWRWRYELLGVPIEIYDVFQGDTKLGCGMRRIVKRANYHMPEREKKYEDQAELRGAIAGARTVHERNVEIPRRPTGLATVSKLRWFPHSPSNPAGWV